jgi:hypothetical protein
MVLIEFAVGEVIQRKLLTLQLIDDVMTNHSSFFPQIRQLMRECDDDDDNNQNRYFVWERESGCTSNFVSTVRILESLPHQDIRIDRSIHSAYDEAATPIL